MDINFDFGGNILVIAVLWIFRNLIVVGIAVIAIYFTGKHFWNKANKKEYTMVQRFRRETLVDKIKRFLSIK